MYVIRVRHLVVPFLITIIILINNHGTRHGNDATEFAVVKLHGDRRYFFRSLAPVLYSRILQTERASISGSINSPAIRREETAKTDELRHVVVNFLRDESEILHEMCSTLCHSYSTKLKIPSSLPIDDRIRAMSSMAVLVGYIH